MFIFQKAAAYAAGRAGGREPAAFSVTATFADESAIILLTYKIIMVELKWVSKIRLACGVERGKTVGKRRRLSVHVSREAGETAFYDQKMQKKEKET